MVRTITISILCVLLFISCHKDDPLIEIQPRNNSMNLEDLEPGQTFKYVLLESAGISNEEYFDFNYTNDTLLLEVVSVSQGKATIKETITKDSKIFNTIEDYYWGYEDSVYTNTWFIENDSLKFDDLYNFNSHLLPRAWFSLDIKLDKEVEIQGWKPVYPHYDGDSHLYTTDYQLNDLPYDTLGIFINNKPLSSDGGGATLFYSKTLGIVRTSFYSYWSPRVQGWDRIE